MNNENNRFEVPTAGLVYIPRFIKQESDMEYGSVVTHENYNEKLNLNTMQGDYNTEVLRHLFTDPNADTNYHIAYIDQTIVDLAKHADDRVDEVEYAIDHFNQVAEDVNARMDAIDTTVLHLLDGTTKPKVSQYADKITGVETAGSHVYYGTDYNGNVGFHILHDPLYAEDISSSSVDISGIYFTPRLDSITEPMLNESIRKKINRETISDYDELENRPLINGILLTGDVALDTLGIQPAGNYLTSVPSSYATLNDTKYWVNTQLGNYYNKDQSNSNYAPRVSTANGISAAQSRADSAYSLATTANNTASAKNRIFVQSWEPGGTVPGDLWIKV